MHSARTDHYRIVKSNQYRDWISKGVATDHVVATPFALLGKMRDGAVMDLNLKGKRALVFASSEGIGKGIAHVLAAEGAFVGLCARNTEKLERAAREIGAKHTQSVDLLKPGAARTAVKTFVSAVGGIDILVTNAGGPPKGYFESITDANWREGFQGLWMSVVDAALEALPHMKAQKSGRIILVTSLAAKEPIAKLTVSNGLRAGLMGLVKSLSHEVAEFGVTVNSILPGYTETERLKELGFDSSLTESIPAKRLAQPKEIGALAAFLASDQAAYITGQHIAVDGGKMMGTV